MNEGEEGAVVAGAMVPGAGSQLSDAGAPTSDRGMTPATTQGASGGCSVLSTGSLKFRYV